MKRTRCSEDRTLHRWTRGAIVVALVLLPILYRASRAPRAEDRVVLAYLDPGVGSVMVQILIAAFAGAAVAIRVYWRKIKRFLGFRSPEAEEEETERKAASDE